MSREIIDLRPESWGLRDEKKGMRHGGEELDARFHGHDNKFQRARE
jgi:hypothetical protein